MPSFGPHSKANHADEQQALTREHHFSAVSHYLPAITESLEHYRQGQKEDTVLQQVSWYCQEGWPQAYSFHAYLKCF